MKTGYIKFSNFEQFYDIIADSPKEWHIYFGFDEATILAVNKKDYDNRMEVSILPYTFTEVFMMLFTLLEED